MSKKHADEADSSTRILELGKEQTEAAVGVQQEVLKACENAGHFWLDRVKSEADLWSKISMKMASVRSALEAIAIYQDWMAERIRMFIDDGKRMSDELQKLMQKTTDPRH